KITDAKAVMADFDSKKTDLQASIKRIKETLNNVGTDFSQSATSEAPQATSTATVANEQQNTSAKSLPKTNETSSPILLSTIGTFFVTLGILLKKRIN
ncbi:LPXTG cell wall anchor domain-containing protein, partial [Enterococcus durans]|uniref:LPXTG cell wall anchor domain-containing protein n=2 Tax=Enterococcus TaxID=1350 RepID=UPI0039A6C604